MDSGAGLISEYFPGLTVEQMSRFEKLLPLYKAWNEKINVVSRKDIDHLYTRHVLHSLGIARVINFAEGARVLDAGTGGGFPGIPLAIFFPGVNFYLVDSIGKKIKVVHEIAAALGLRNITAVQGRVEAVKRKFDFAVSRAVAPLAEMLVWLQPLVVKGKMGTLPNGMFFLKGGDLTAEIEATGRDIREFALTDFFKEDFFAGKKILYLEAGKEKNK